MLNGHVQLSVLSVLLSHILRTRVIQALLVIIPSPLILDSFNGLLLVEKINDLSEASDLKQLDVTSLQLLTSKVVNVYVYKLVLVYMLFVIVRIVLIQIRTDLLCLLQSKESPLVFVEEDLH